MPPPPPEMTAGETALLMTIKRDDWGLCHMRVWGGRSIRWRQWIEYMVIACSKLPQNNGNLPLPFFGGNYPIVILNNIYS